MITIKCSIERLRSKLVVKAHFVVSSDSAIYNRSKRIAYQSHKSFRDNMIIAARFLCAEHGLPCQQWQVNLLECEEIAFFSTGDCIQSIEF